MTRHPRLDPVDPGPVRRRIRTCTICGRPAIVGDRCADHDGPDAVGALVVGFLALVTMVIIAALGWYLSAPRSAPDPTAPTPSPAMAGLDRVAPGPVVSASGPEPSGAPSGQGEASAPADSSADPVGAPPEAVIVPPLEVQRGWATHCLDNGRLCVGWDDRYVGAVPSFSYGDDPYWVRVCTLDGGACTEVLVVSYCACGDRRGDPTIIDLSAPAFRELAPLGRGVVMVTLERLEGVPTGPTLPPTDVDP